MESLKKYFKKRNKNIVTLLGNQQETYKTETYHKLRVEIKKLNALFNLVKHCSKDFKKNKTFRPLKRIFKQAGKIREVQLQRTALEEHFSQNLLTGYRNFLSDIEQNEQKSFFELIRNTSKNIQKKNRKAAELLSKIHKKEAKRHLENQGTSIKKLLGKKKLKKRQIHLFRKKLIEHHYNLQSLNFRKKNKKNFKADDLSKLLGKWHDYTVIVRNLKKITPNTINSEEQQLLESAKNSFTTKSNLLLETIYGTIPLLDF